MNDLREQIINLIWEHDKNPNRGKLADQIIALFPMSSKSTPNDTINRWRDTEVRKRGDK